MSKRNYTKRKPGDVVNGATLIERINGRLWKMQCSCGRMFISQPSETSGRCRDCGYKFLSSKFTIHNESPRSGRNASRIYNIWVSMKSRCNNKNNPVYMLYGGRGISVCDEWNEFKAFKEWAMNNGYSDQLTIDRINVNGNYEPDNCRWATQKEQCRNKRDNHYLTFQGETKTLIEWSELVGIRQETIRHRINDYGYTVEEALTLRPGELRSANK